MRPFFRYCQLIGFFPFRMEFEKTTKRFKNFSFSWSYPITWWFIVFTLVNYVSYYVSTTQLFKSSHFNNLPFLVYVTLMTVMVIYVAIVMLSRFVITSRFSHLYKAIEFMRLAEFTLTKDEHPNCKNTINKRMTIGLIINFIWVIQILYCVMLITFSLSCHFLFRYSSLLAQCTHSQMMI